MLNIGPPSSPDDAVTKSYIDATTDEILYYGEHDPRFIEIEQILVEVGVRCWSISAYATTYLPQGVEPTTAICITKNLFNAPDRRVLANILGGIFTIHVDKLDMYQLPSPARLFDIHNPNFFQELARYLRKERAISLPTYWLVRLKLWWNK